jgi:hypothetical protein
MIAWSASASFMKLWRTGTIKIPLGIFKDFKIDAVRIENNEITISLFHKDHFLLSLNRDAL